MATPRYFVDLPIADMSGRPSNETERLRIAGSPRPSPTATLGESLKSDRSSGGLISVAGDSTPRYQIAALNGPPRPYSAGESVS